MKFPPPHSSHYWKISKDSSCDRVEGIFSRRRHIVASGRQRITFNAQWMNINHNLSSLVVEKFYANVDSMANVNLTLCC